MNRTERHRRNRRKSCYAVASHRARMARRQGRSHLIALVLFLWAILSGPFRPLLVSGPPSSDDTDGADWPITDYERGLGGETFLRPRRALGVGRYRSRPSLARLIADLRRPAARKDAVVELVARITDPTIRAWVVERIDKDEINRLSVWARPGCSEETTMAAWRGEALAALADAAPDASATPDTRTLLQVAKLLENLAGTDTGAPQGAMKPGQGTSASTD